MYIYNRAAVFEMDMRSLNNQVFLVFLTLTNFCLLIMLISDYRPSPIHGRLEIWKSRYLEPARILKAPSRDDVGEMN